MIHDTLGERKVNLADRVWAVAATHRARPALWALDEELSYGELTDLAARAATALLDAGIRPGDRVAILSRRSVYAYAKMLAVLRAGAVYVPLNPRWPLDRNRAMLERAEATALLIDASSIVRFESLLREPPSTLRVVATLDGTLGEPRNELRLISARTIEATTPRNEWPRRTADDVCYIIFTSGTTGKPKGVPATHGGVTAYLDGVTAVTAMRAEDRVANFSEITFDMATHNMYTAWTSGAALISANDQDNRAIHEFIARHAITALMVVPSAVALAIQSGNLTPGSLPTLRFSYLGGEAVPRVLTQAWADAAPSCDIYNVYGPTETTVVVTMFPFRRGEQDPRSVVPLGPIFPHLRAMVVGADDRATPDGEAGELLVAGSQLSPGYWRAPELDAQKFVTLDGTRWYRTGDVVRLGPDGFEYLGRTDHQVKILGFRVELLEIESALRRAASRDMVAVIAWPITAEGNAQGTVAFVAGASLDEAVVVGELRKQLPTYMIPSQFVYIPELPLNDNGKVDHGALKEHPALKQAAATPQSRAASSGPLEVAPTILAICAEVLRAPDLRLEDSWSARGGDSLATILVVGAARDAGIELPMNAFDAEATIAQLAASAVDAEEAARPLPPGRAYRPLAGQAFFIEMALGSGRPDLWNNSEGFTLEGELDAAALRLAAEELMARHDALRSRIVAGPNGETWFAPVDECELAWVYRDVSTLAPAKANAAWLAHCQDDIERSFDFERGPLVRFALWRFGPEQHRLLLTTHHAVSDIHSHNLRLEELLRSYHAHRSGVPTPPRAPAPSMQSYAEWLDQQSTAPAEAYYRSLAEGIDDAATGLTGQRASGRANIPTSIIPTKPSPREGSSTTAPYDAWSSGYFAAVTPLERNTMSRLRRFSERLNLPISSIAYGLWAFTIGQMESKPDVLFSTLLSGRRCPFPRVDLVMGCLVKSAMLRVRVAPTLPAIEILRETHQQLERLRPIEWLLEPSESPSMSLRDEWCRDPRRPAGERQVPLVLRTTQFTIEQGKPRSAMPFAPLRLVSEADWMSGLSAMQLVGAVQAGPEWRLVVAGVRGRFTQEEVQAIADRYLASLARLDELETVSFAEALNW